MIGKTTTWLKQTRSKDGMVKMVVRGVHLGYKWKGVPIPKLDAPSIN